MGLLTRFLVEQLLRAKQDWERTGIALAEAQIEENSAYQRLKLYEDPTNFPIKAKQGIKRK